MTLRFALMATALAATPAAALAGNVEVTLNKVRAGHTLFASLQNQGQFMSPDAVSAKTVSDPAAGTVKVTFENVPAGDYAIMVWHDDNGNGQFDSDPDTRLPLDGWTMSNAEKLTGMPTFDIVKTPIAAEGASIELDMHYGRPAS